MHILGTVLAVLGAWLMLAVPVALLAGRFLRVGSERSAANAAHQMNPGSVDSSAA